MRTIHIGAIGILLGGLAVAAPAEAPSLVALRNLEPGIWQLRSRDNPGVSRSLCLGDAMALIQLRHPGAACSRFVISDAPGEATVHYTCPGTGHGRTHVTVETPRLLQLDTQGVTGAGPFDDAYQARRIGTCAGH